MVRVTPFERLRKIFPKTAEVKLNEVIHEFDLDAKHTVDEVFVAGNTRAAITEVEVFGLVIRLDSTGHAVSVYFPSARGSAGTSDGFERDVIEWQETA